MARHTWYCRWAGQDCENGWIWMIKADSVHGAELAEIVFVRRVVAMPGHNIERGK